MRVSSGLKYAQENLEKMTYSLIPDFNSLTLFFY
jgi:hypothetical protein